MPATLNGTVFHDLNHEGQYVPGSPGISQVVLVLAFMVQVMKYGSIKGCGHDLFLLDQLRFWLIT